MSAKSREVALESAIKCCPRLHQLLQLINYKIPPINFYNYIIPYNCMEFKIIPTKFNNIHIHPLKYLILYFLYTITFLLLL